MPRPDHRRRRAAPRRLAGLLGATGTSAPARGLSVHGRRASPIGLRTRQRLRQLRPRPRPVPDDTRYANAHAHDPPVLPAMAGWDLLLGEPERAVGAGGDRRRKVLGVGTGNSVIVPDGVMRPTTSPNRSTNQTFPSGPAVMLSGRPFAVGTGGTDTTPVGVIRPISVLHRLGEPDVPVGAGGDPVQHARAGGDGCDVGGTRSRRRRE